MTNTDLNAYVGNWVNKLNDANVCPYAKSVYDNSKLKLIQKLLVILKNLIYSIR